MVSWHLTGIPYFYRVSKVTVTVTVEFDLI
jgi:hypothetical protein